MSGRAPERRRVSFLRQLGLWLAGLVGSRYDGLHNFHVVTPGVLLRCGQPRVSDLEQIHREHGLKTVVVARGGTRHPLRGRWFRLERDWCARRGVQLVHLPFSDAAAAPRAVVDQFLGVMRDAARHPVLVHCEQGFHRTGILCAAYRMEIEGWSREAAFRELEALGFEMGRDKRRLLLDVLSAPATHADTAPA